jgi:competence protein ComGC
MKKKRLITLAIIILIVILVILAIRMFVKKEQAQESKIINIYDKLVTSQEYLCTIEQDDENKIIMAKKGEKTIIDQYSGESHSTTLVKDENTYLVLHDRQEYYVYERNNVEQSILTDGLKELINKSYEVGTEKVKGKNYSYEEYEGSTVFTLSSTLALNEEGVKTRVYFNKDSELVYIKTIFGDQNELLKVSLSYEAEDSLFDIPENYAEN